MMHVGALIDPPHHGGGLLVKMRRWSFRCKAAIRSNLHAFARSIAIEETLESIYDTLHGRQNAFLLELVVERIGGDFGPHDVRTDSVERYAFFWKVFAVAADEANNSTESEVSNK